MPGGSQEVEAPLSPSSTFAFMLSENVRPGTQLAALQGSLSSLQDNPPLNPREIVESCVDVGEKSGINFEDTLLIFALLNRKFYEALLGICQQQSAKGIYTETIQTAVNAYAIPGQKNLVCSAIAECLAWDLIHHPPSNLCEDIAKLEKLADLGSVAAKIQLIVFYWGQFQKEVYDLLKNPLTAKSIYQQYFASNSPNRENSNDDNTPSVVKTYVVLNKLLAEAIQVRPAVEAEVVGKVRQQLKAFLQDVIPKCLHTEDEPCRSLACIPC